MVTSKMTNLIKIFSCAVVLVLVFSHSKATHLLVKYLIDYYKERVRSAAEYTFPPDARAFEAQDTTIRGIY